MLMSTKKLFVEPRISLSLAAKKKLVDILSAPQTQTQKKSLQRARGSYAYYEAKWTKTK